MAARAHTGEIGSTMYSYAAFKCVMYAHAQEFEKLPRDIFAANSWSGEGEGASEKKFAPLAVAWGGGGGGFKTKKIK
jgi:hypothetical protein